MRDISSIRRKIYEVSHSESEWIREVSRTIVQALELPLGLYVRRVGRPGERLDPGLTFGIDLPFDPHELHRRASLGEFTAERQNLYKVRPTVTTYQELRTAGALPTIAPTLDVFAREHGVSDFLILAAGDPASGRLLVATPWPQPLTLSEADRDAWLRIGVHLAAAMRLRTASPTSDQNQDIAAELWQGLLRGVWTVAESFDADGRRILVIRKTPPSTRAEVALSARERQVLSHAARGCSNKLIAYQLGMSTSTAATHLKNGLRKLGVPSRVELIQHANRLMGPHDLPTAVGEEVSDVDFDVLENALVVCARELARLARSDSEQAVSDAERKLRVQQLRTTIGAFERLLSSIDVA